MRSLLFSIALSLILVFGACNTFVDIKPKAQITADLAFEDLNDFQLAAAGLYAGLRSGDLYGADLIVLGDIMSDNITLGPITLGGYAQEYAWTYTAQSGTPAGLFISLYQVIDRANNIINRIDGVLPTDLPCQEFKKEARKIKGEAYVVRALCYYNLLRYFCDAPTKIPDLNAPNTGVPIKLQSSITLPARDPYQKVLDLIKSDLDAGLNFLETCSSVNLNAPPVERIYITPAVVHALRARIAYDLAPNGTSSPFWNEVETHTTKILSDSRYAINKDLEGLWGRTDNTEIIFKIFNDATDGSGNALQLIFHGFYTKITPPPGFPNVNLRTASIDFVPSRGLFELFQQDEDFADDLRVGHYFDTLAYPGPGKDTVARVPYKFRQKPNAAQDGQSDNIVFRASEMLLMRAEARLNLGNTTGALEDLNLLRVNRNMRALVGLTPSQIRVRLSQERRKELAFEGFRFFDLRKLNFGLQRSADCKDPACNLESGSPKWIFPIPFNEINVNPNMVQNPGYLQ